jgi:hypothetical protein
LLVNLILTAGVVAMWIRLNRPQKDDPRLSKGLQLLQSKIAVLEDLSDRTEVQVNQLTALLEQKCKDIQTKIQASEKQLAKIDQSTQKSLEVAKIFQDRIPHTEILERQNTIKYVKAARLAHQGLSFDEIAQQVDLSRGEIEFIAKVNKDQLMFCEDSLPEWAQESADTGAGEAESLIEPGTLQMPAMNPFQLPRDMSAAFDVPQNDQQALKKLGEAFKAACAESVIEENKPGLNLVGEETPPAPAASSATTSSGTQTKTVAAAAVVKAKTPNIRPVEFRRIDMAKDLG